MLQTREVQTCIRCRDSKRRCDKAKPKCSRCQRAGVPCTYDTPQSSDASTPSTETLTPSSELESTQSIPKASRGILSSASTPQKVIKRRDRACLSCTRCHRLKVKCDKKQPCCSRCARSGYEKTCIYTHKVTSTQMTCPSSPFILAGEDPEFVVATWFLRKRGSSHWRALLARLESLSGMDFPPFSMAVKEHIEGDCSSDLTLPGNFPFGSPESARYATLDKVHSLLQASHSNAQSYIGNYLEIYHASMPILEISTFQQEVAKYWNSPEKVDLCWLALFLVVLGLGSYAKDRDQVMSAEFFFASEACLARTPYMFRPTVANIRTLCLLVLAKQVANATCWAIDACWNIMGIIVRLSLMMALHQEWLPGLDLPVLAKERELRGRLWTAVVYLDIQMCLITGQQSLLPQETLLTTGVPGIPVVLEDCWDTIIPQSFPIICHFLGRINSTFDQISYDEVLQYDLEIRQLMRHCATLQGSHVLRLTLDIFFRRVLLVLHRSHALDADAPTLFPTSYWSSLECSLALIVHHHEISDVPNHSSSIELVGRPFMLDFFAASLTTCLHLMRSDAPLAATLTSEGTIPPRKTIVDTLRVCIDIFGREQDKSICFRSGYRLLEAVYGLVPKT